MILETLKNWHSPLETLTTTLGAALARSLLSTLHETVKEWRATKLFEEMRDSYLQFLNTHLGSIKANVARALRIERAKPITRNDKLMDRYIAEETTTLETGRLRTRHTEYATEIQDMTGKDVTIKAWDEKAKKLALETIGPDPYSREVGVMARIRAYYQIASMRFVDNIVQAVEADLFVKFRDLEYDLMGALRVLEEDGRPLSSTLLAH
jgi:hypothetical protein